MELKIRIYLYSGTPLGIMERGITEKILTITDENYFEYKFLLEEELERLKKLLYKYKDMGAIKTISRNLKVRKRKYKVQIMEILYAQKTIKQALKTMQTFK